MRPPQSWLLSSLAVVLMVATGLAQTSLAAARSVPSKSVLTNVTVTLGQPTEQATTLSTTRVPVGRVVFAVTNHGVLPHNFKICARATGSTKPNDCAGRSTSTLGSGKTTTLTVVFKQTGAFEYLSTVPEHATAQMKGLLNVGLKGGQTITPTKLTLARKVTACMHSHGFPNYPDTGSSRNGPKPSAAQANAAEQNCERQARKALGLP
jgi:plastocyanin